MTPTTHYFDITDILMYVERETTVSGIQRVAFEVIKQVIRSVGADAVKLSFWDLRARKYMVTDLSFLKDGVELTPELLSNVFFGSALEIETDIPPTLIRYRNRPVKYRFHLLRQTIMAWRGNEVFFQRKGSSIEEWKNYRARKGKLAPRSAVNLTLLPADEQVKSGDQIILLGAVWNIDGMSDALKALRDEQGAHVAQMVHDLIPLLCPEHLADDISQAFYFWLESALDYSDRYIANSENTARDLERFMDEVGRRIPVDVVPLAQQLSPPLHAPEQETSRPIKAHLRTLAPISRDMMNLLKMPYVLVVGTMETRKNAWRLAQAWQRLSQDRGLDVPKLVFAGKPGWQNNDFDELMQATGHLGGWARIFRRPSDAELRFLFENCLFTATVSHYEGWGLPIGESLGFGKTAVVADNSSMPEVGQDMVEYCDALSIDSIYTACRKLIEDPAHREMLEARIANTNLRTWHDVAQDIINITPDSPKN